MSGFDTQSLIWFNGEFRRWQDATIHVMSHVVHYGSNVFEGMRCYETKRGPAIFRLDDHLKRLYRSAKIYGMDIPYDRGTLAHACRELVIRNKMDECYIRPIAFRGFGALGIDPTSCPVDVAIGTLPWGKYLGEGALEDGIDACISSWQKLRPNTIPPGSKAGGQYLISQLVKVEAKKNGYAEGILLDAHGYVSEGSGENIFMIFEGKAYTPPIAASILPGITRDCAISLLKSMGMEVLEQNIPREMLYTADELFFTGTAAEITPIRSLDKTPIGAGTPGPVTKAVQKTFFQIIRGETEDRYKWLNFVNQ